MGGRRGRGTKSVWGPMEKEAAAKEGLTLQTGWEGEEKPQRQLYSQNRARVVVVVVVFVCRKFANVLPLLNPPRLGSSYKYTGVGRTPE